MRRPSSEKPREHNKRGAECPVCAYQKAWPRHWGMQLWAIDFLYFPGLIDPEQNRWPNWMGIVIRLTFSAFFLSQGDGFTPMGIYDGVSGLLLLITYLPVTRATKI